MKWILCTITSLLVLNSEAQDHYPLYSHAISLEHSFVPGIILYGAFIPDNLEYAIRIDKKFYLQGGIFVQGAETTPGETFFTEGFAFYAGSSMKFYLFRKAYFTPALNLYYDNYGGENILYSSSLTIGPTVAFEYFLSDRLSLRLDVVNINVGIGFPNSDFIGTSHRLVGVGGRYNFNW